MAHDTLSDHRDRQTHAAAKIAVQKIRMSKGGASEQQQVDDAQLLNELHHNKAAVDLNRALFDYSAEPGTA